MDWTGFAGWVVAVAGAISTGATLYFTRRKEARKDAIAEWEAITVRLEADYAKLEKRYDALEARFNSELEQKSIMMRRVDDLTDKAADCEKRAFILSGGLDRAKGEIAVLQKHIGPTVLEKVQEIAAETHEQTGLLQGIAEQVKDKEEK